ncbi:hypothetical protein ACOMHN_044480 [Nucella lapillus]
MPKNHFATLGIKPGAGEKEVKKAYRTLAKQWHPDKNSNPGAEEKFKEIGGAYEYLQSNDRRNILARELTKKKEPEVKTFTQATKESKPSTSHASTSSQPSGSRPPPSASFTSAGGQSSKENHSPGSKGKKNKAPHWSDSFHKKPKGQSAAQATSGQSKGGWKPWTSDWQDGAEDQAPPPRFSDAFSTFRTFVDQLNGQFGATFFLSRRQLLDCLGRRQTRCWVGMGGGRTPGQGPGPRVGARRNRPRAMWPRNVDTQGDWRTIYCLLLAPVNVRHEQFCGKFDAPSDTDEEDHSPRYAGYAYSSDDNDNDYDDYAADYGAGRGGQQDWRSKHEDVLHKIRRDRKTYAAELKRQASEEHCCKWCGRTFSLSALQRHLPICKEHVKRHGRPMNPSTNGGPAADSKFARSRKYSESVPKPTARPGPSQGFSRRTSEADVRDEDTYSQTSPPSSPNPFPPPGTRFSHPGTARARGSGTKPGPSTDGPQRSAASDTGRKPSSTDAAGKGKPTTNGASRPTQPTSSTSSGVQDGLNGKKFQGTGLKFGATNPTSRRTNGRGTAKQ